MIQSVEFCGHGLVARENCPIKSVNHDTQLIFSSAALCDISYTAKFGLQNDTCITFFCIY